jgi:hypothetical protein
VCVYSVQACGSAGILDNSRNESMTLIDSYEHPHRNPVDVVEHMASHRDWSFARASEDEVTMVVSGRWSDYQVSFTWMSDIHALHLASAFDLKAPAPRRAELAKLVTKINEQLWIGHFDYWPKDGLIMFRHALMLAGGVNTSDGQCEAVLGLAIDACERYFQAFQFVVWGGKSAREALAAAMFETSGEA